ncbi:MAG TPA: short-chain dehydrogenase, partial [Erythrobacter sp.]|nr:short-chain dehydrogenase [Erythrobacter sp.]
VAEVDGSSPEGGVRSYAIDPASADRLWSLSEELVGESFST